MQTAPSESLPPEFENRNRKSKETENRAAIIGSAKPARRREAMATAVRSTIEAYLGPRAESLLGFHSPKIARERLHLPGPDFIDRVWAGSDRSIRVLINLERLFGHGRLGRTGYMSILPVDQGIEHSAGARFAKHPDYFDGENIVKLAIEGGC